MKTFVILCAGSLLALAPGRVVAEEAAAPAAAAQQVTIPAGTTLLVKLGGNLSSEDKPGKKFDGKLMNAVVVNGVTAIPADSTVIGQVSDAKKAPRLAGQAKVVFELVQVRISGEMVPVVTDPIAEVGERAIKDAARGAAAGAVIGAIADGGKGAGKGAAIGGATGGMKKAEKAKAKAGDVVEFRMLAPLTVAVK